MREDITSIPISEVFEPRDGCPICRMRDMLEERMVEYITGAAMMESDVRQETNRQGFCSCHYEMMMKKRNRLSLALILESHLAELEHRVFDGPPIIGKTAGKQAQSAQGSAAGCFVCAQVDKAMERMISNMCRLWENQRDFRDLFDEQTGLCLPHFSLVVQSAKAGMNKKYAPDFCKAAAALSKSSLAGLREDVSHFCRMFDYRNSGADADWGNSRDAIERAVAWLTARGG